MIDALCFALYGKPFRMVNKPGLINSVNGKNCEVEVTFETNGKTYRVVRAIKPNKFDIFCDGTLFTQDAAARDYQKVLENQILMMTFKTFTQIVILGSNAFTPFMQLSSGARREVIEDILDIGVFSTMNQLLKAQIQETKDQQHTTDVGIKTGKERAAGLDRLLTTLATKNAARSGEIVSAIAGIDAQITALESQLAQCVEANDELKAKTAPLQKLSDANTDLAGKTARVEFECSTLREQHTFFTDHSHCPTCEQDIATAHKNAMVTALATSISGATTRLNQYAEVRTQVRERIAALQQHTETINQNNLRISGIKSNIAALNKQHAALVHELERQHTVGNDVAIASAEFRASVAELKLLTATRKEIGQQMLMQENASVLLRDAGIKTAIIKEYLPLINRYLAKYLAELQMDVDFSLDENFNEVIRSRYRDSFVYGNFSEGEKLRIDIGLLLAWRHMAKLKNSASTNLLIIDEVLSGRLDQTNQDIVIDLVNALAHEGTRIFVIAHQDSLTDKFRSGIKFEKQGNFSVMV